MKLMRGLVVKNVFYAAYWKDVSAMVPVAGFEPATP